MFSRELSPYPQKPVLLIFLAFTLGCAAFALYWVHFVGDAAAAMRHPATGWMFIAIGFSASFWIHIGYTVWLVLRRKGGAVRFFFFNALWLANACAVTALLFVIFSHAAG